MGCDGEDPAAGVYAGRAQGEATPFAIAARLHEPRSARLERRIPTPSTQARWTIRPPFTRPSPFLNVAVAPKSAAQSIAEFAGMMSRIVWN
jgi:hypothetical protein